MSCLLSYVKNRYYCSQCRTFRHGSTHCPITRRRAALIVLIRLQLEIVENEETLIHLLYQMPRENLVVIARNYELDTMVNTEVLIRNMVNHMARIQVSGKLLASIRIRRLCEQYPGVELQEIIAIKMQEMYISGRDSQISSDEIVSNIRQYIFTELYNNQPRAIKLKIRSGFIYGTRQLLNNSRIPSAPPRQPIPMVTMNSENIIIIKSSVIANDVNEEKECCICFNSKPMKDFVKTGCNHEYCYSCIESHLMKDVTHRCPMCRTTISTLTYSSRPLML